MFGIDTGVLIIFGYIFAGVSFMESVVLAYRHRTPMALLIGVAVGVAGLTLFVYVIPVIINFGHFLAGR